MEVGLSFTQFQHHGQHIHNNSDEVHWADSESALHHCTKSIFYFYSKTASSSIQFMPLSMYASSHYFRQRNATGIDS